MSDLLAAPVADVELGADLVGDGVLSTIPPRLKDASGMSAIAKCTPSDLLTSWEIWITT